MRCRVRGWLAVEYGDYPNSIGLQEVMNYGVELSPVFKGPVATDEEVSVLHRRWNVTRGVSTYACADTTTSFPPVDLRTEIVTTIHSNIGFYSRQGTRQRKVAFMNVYRLMHRDADCPDLEMIISYISEQTKRLKAQGIYRQNDVALLRPFNKSQYIY